MPDDVRSIRPDCEADGIQLAREDHDKESAEVLIAERTSHDPPEFHRISEGSGDGVVKQK